MSLLQKASIITTPTAYAEDYLYSIKPAIPFGQELITNGNFVTDSDWSKNNAAISGGQATITVTGGAFSGVAQTLSYTSGRKYRLVANIKGASGSSGKQVRFMDNSSDIGGLTTSNGVITLNESVQNVDIIWTANSNSNIIRNDRHTSSGDYSWVIYDISIKELTDADFDFDRNSTGTRVNEDYLIEDVPYNLLTYSTDFTFWTQADTSTVQIEDSFDNSNNAYRVSITSAGGFQTIRKTGLNLSGQQTFSIYAKKDTLNFTRILFGGVSRNFWVDLANGTQGTTTGSFDSITITNAGNGFFKIVATFTTTSPVTYIYLYPSTADGNVTQSSGSVIFQYAQLVKGDQPKNYLQTTDRLDIPRIDYTNGEPSILLEPSRTNLVTYSETLSGYWTLQGSSLIADNTAVNPTGNTFANKLNSTNTSTFRSLTRSESTAWDSKTLTMSCFAKRITNDYIFFYNIGSVNGINGLWFNISNGTIGTNGAAWSNAKIENYGNGWYRCSAKITFGTSTNYLYINNSDGNNNTTSTVGSQTYIWGTQIEEGSYATSLIHTSGSAVTRSADAANNAGNSDLINSTEGVLYVEFKGQNDNTFNYISVSDGGTTNYAAILCSDVDNEIAYRYYVSNSGVQILTSVSNLLEFNKIAVKWKANDFSIYINGVQVGASTSGSVNSAGTFNNVSFARGTSNNTPFYGNAKMVAVFKEALTDLELEKLTGYNNHELYMNYYNRLSYLGLVEEYNVESDINNYIL